MSAGGLERRAAAVILLLVAGGAIAAYASRAYRAAPHAKHLLPLPFDVTRVMVPMRDGVKLETVIFVPKAHREALPILLKRGPYGVPADEDLRGASSRLITDGYAFVVQNIRGRFNSEGTFAMIRPLRAAPGPMATDESTDAYDTIDWLVHHVPRNTGRVCTFGVSYGGWTTAMSLVDPHPALACASEQAAMGDLFVNDDFHHNGAFRLSYGFEYTFLLETTKDKNSDFEFDQHDTYDWYLRLGALPHADERYLHGKLPTWEDFALHPNRDDFWKRRAIAERMKPATVPNLNVAGWWDQEDFVGPLDIYAAQEKSDVGRRNYLVVGPWSHGQWGYDDGRTLGAIDFGSDTGKEFRKLEADWFAHWLHDGPLDLPEATIFETGSNRWKKLDHWPPQTGVTPTKLYLREDRAASFDAPTDADGHDSYVSDPANPVPYRRRPIGPTYPGPEWPAWLVEDQRFVDHRPDVLTWQTGPLDHDVVVNGDIAADLYASTTGTDSDWVVKLIDVYPEDKPAGSDAGAEEQDASAPDMRGYQLMIASEIMRGRFRHSMEHPEPVPAGAVVRYAIGLHSNAHAFLRGHRIMVQVQSTWFPVYDRNPQTYVDNIYKAADSDYAEATQRVFRTREAPSSLVLPIVSP